MIELKILATRIFRYKDIIYEIDINIYILGMTHRFLKTLTYIVQDIILTCKKFEAFIIRIKGAIRDNN